jgi:serine/threonine protein kinase
LNRPQLARSIVRPFALVLAVRPRRGDHTFLVESVPNQVTISSVSRPQCRALDKAHRAGVVHRDLKPANTLSTRGNLPPSAFQILEQLADGEPEIQSRLKVWRDMLSAATTQARQTSSLHQNFPPITLELLFWSWGVPNERQWSHR